MNREKPDTTQPLTGEGGRPAGRKPGRRLMAVLVTVFAAVFLAGAGIFYLALYQSPGSPELDDGADRPVRLTVNKGAAFSTITRELHRQGLVRYPRIISLYAKLRRYDRQVHAGTYQFSPGETPNQILNKLIAGNVLKIAVTIPEGYTIRQIAKTLAEAVGTDSAAFYRAASDPVRQAEWVVETASLEGYLFPDTYWVPWGSRVDAVVDMMLSRLAAVFDSSLQERARLMNLSRHEVLTLASIIEAEARLPRERKLISAVYHNRLSRRMRLEADPTVAYAMGEYKGRLLFKDLEIDSPYNTYLHYGLPPGPICNPGQASIKAALYPDSTSRALYFVAQGDGSHIFSLTLKDHLAAVREAMRSKQR
jgi:UPF0755 protein